MAWQPPASDAVDTGWQPPAGDAVIENATQPAQPDAFQRYGGLLPAAGGIAGALAGGAVSAPAGGTGALPGAVLGGAAGESARQLIGRYLGEPSPATSLQAAGQIGKQGVIQGAGELAGEVAGPIIDLAKPLAGSAAQGMSKIASAFTGGKSDEFLQAARQGYSTYLAPSMNAAREKFGQALENVGINPKGPLEARYDPQLSVARENASNAIAKLEANQPLSAEEAFRGRQAIDRVIASTSPKDKNTLAAMYDDRSKLDAVISQQAGPLKDASTMYRQAIVKNGMTQPLRVTKSGTYSAVVPILSAVGGSLSGVAGGKEAGVGTALGGMAATSPALWGLGATTAGTAAKVATNPLILQALVSQYLQHLTSQGGPSQ